MKLLHRPISASDWISDRFCFISIVLEMKADNEPAISLPAYFESVKKWKYDLKKKTKQQNNQKVAHGAMHFGKGQKWCSALWLNAI